MKEYEVLYLKEIIRELLREEVQANNSISLGGVEVSSSEKLEVVEQTAQRLIDKNQDFLLARNKLKATLNYP